MIKSAGYMLFCAMLFLPIGGRDPYRLTSQEKRTPRKATSSKTGASQSSYLSSEVFPLAEEYKKIKYQRSRWKHWIDFDKDCQNTRNEILIRDSLEEPIFKSKRKCRVDRGLWKCPYTGKVFTNPRKLDIDHLVPLKEAFRSGGYIWSPQKKKDFANDIFIRGRRGQLQAVEASANRSKGAKDPGNWLPKKGQCDYVRDWVYVKKHYGLYYDQKELRVVKRILALCKKELLQK